MQNFQISMHTDFAKISFNAMASPCEILVRNLDAKLIKRIAKIAMSETRRIESKYSRYIKNNLVAQMNNSRGRTVPIDSETFNLLEYAKNIHQLSDGLFDITSGALRKVWRFEKNAQPPTESEIRDVLPHIGFKLLEYDDHSFRCPNNTEIDFGGVGKEYAVDQVSNLLRPICSESKSSYLVNYGGDISAVKLDEQHQKWIVGVESASNDQQTDSIINILHGSVATSGNTKRHLQYKGKLYGHILNPKTGYPIEDAPRSITTFASSCLVAGSFSSLAMLQGKNAEAFLKENELDYICIW